MPIIFFYERNTERSNNISTGLKEFYFGRGKVDQSSRQGISDIYADGITGFEVNRAAKVIAAKNTESTYYYCVTYRGRYSFFYLPDSNNTQTAGKLIKYSWFILVKTLRRKCPLTIVIVSYLSSTYVDFTIVNNSFK